MSIPIDEPTLIKAGTIIRHKGGGTLYLSPSPDVSPAHSNEHLTGRTATRIETDVWAVGDTPVEVELIAPSAPKRSAPEPPSKPKKAAPKKAAKRKPVVRKQRPSKKSK